MDPGSQLSEAAPRLSGTQRRLLALSVLVAVLAVLLGAFALPRSPQIFPEFGENDFLEYWTADRLMQDGKDLYDPALVVELEHKLGWLHEKPLMMWNPPWAPALLAPVMSFPFDRAAALFLGLNAGLAVLVSAFAGIAFGLDGGVLFAAVLLSFLNFPLFLLLLKGQISMLPAFGVAAFLLSALFRRYFLAGAALVLVTIKPHLAFLLVAPLCAWFFSKQLSARGRWRMVLGFLVAGTSLLLLSELHGPGSLGFWWNRGVHRSSPLLIDVTQWRTSTLSFVLRNIIYHYTAKFTVWPMWAVPILALLAVLGLTAVICRRVAFSFPTAFALLLPLSLACAPFGWIFDCVTCAISAIWIFGRIASPGAPREAKLLLGISLIALQIGTLWLGVTTDHELDWYWFYAPCVFLLSYLSWAFGRDHSRATISLRDEPLEQDGTAWSGPSSAFGGFLTLLPILVVASVLRFFGNTRLPPYFDESGNILLGISPITRTILHPVRQARPFLAYQFTLPALMPGDPLFWSRTFTGLTAIIGIGLLFFIMQRTFGRRAAIIAALLWSLNPCLLFHDRMALQDPFISLFLLAAIGSFVLSKNWPLNVQARFAQSWRSWVGFGVFFGLAVATKATAAIYTPFLALLLSVFATRSGRRIRLSLDLIHYALFSLAVATATVYLIGGTFYEFGLDHMMLGHLAAATGDLPAGRISQAWQHLMKQWELFSAYLGQPTVYLGTACLILGLLFPSTRVPALLSLGLILLNTQLYRGRWYTRYFHPDFVFHTVFWTLMIQLVWDKLSTVFWRDRNEAPSRRSIIGATVLVVLLTGLWGTHISAFVRDPLHSSVPKHDFYTNGYFSGYGVREVRETIDRELEKHDQFVVFACQFWCSGMYDLLLHSFKDPRLYVIPFELKHPNRILGLQKAMEKFRSSLPGKTGFAVLFEPPRYPVLESIATSGVPDTVLMDFARDPEHDPAVRFRLDRIEVGDRRILLERTQALRQPYADDWVGPKAEFHLTAPVPPELELQFPKSLPPETEVEISINDLRIVQGRVGELPMPLKPAALIPAEVNSAAAAQAPILKITCSDWIVPQLTSKARDNRAFCLHLSQRLAVQSTATSEKDSETADSDESGVAEKGH